jgi:hypothetical protein
MRRIKRPAFHCSMRRASLFCDDFGGIGIISRRIASADFFVSCRLP